LRVEWLCVERAEAEAIYDQGREVVVAVLLRMDGRFVGLNSGLCVRARGSLSSSVGVPCSSGALELVESVSHSR
jgi:hypothetical protein